MNMDCLSALCHLIARHGHVEHSEPSWPGGGPNAPTVSLVWAQDACPEGELSVQWFHPKDVGGTEYVRVLDIHRDGHHLVLRGVQVEGTDYDSECGMWSAVVLL